MGRMMAEILGKKQDIPKGKAALCTSWPETGGGSWGKWHCGRRLPISTGAAYAFKLRKEPRVSVVFFGDGASNQGTFHESINMAAAWDLPIVYVIENNRYAISTGFTRVTKEHRLSTVPWHTASQEKRSTAMMCLPCMKRPQSGGTCPER